MIFINKNSENTVALSLTSNVSITGTPVYFLFKFVNTQTSDETLFSSDDLSNNTPRYNKFNIIETASTINYTASTISLYPGMYDYYVYQMLDRQNLSLSGVSGGFITNGRVEVSGTTLSTGQSNIYTGQTDTKTVYYNR